MHSSPTNLLPVACLFASASARSLRMLTEHKSIPVALTIAGSDSGGGAGIQADLKTFAALGVHGTSVITCVTAQNPKRILAVQACTPNLVEKQLQALFAEFKPRATKTGMLYTAEIVRTVVRFLRKHGKDISLVVDPVAVATSGRSLLRKEAAEALQRELLPLATLVTPNLPEAETLVGRPIHTPEEMRQAARVLREKFGCAVLLKGGHLKRAREAVDIFYDGHDELMLTAPFIRRLALHGTGCTFSAAITAFLARGCTMREAVARGKAYISRAIARRKWVGSHTVLR